VTDSVLDEWVENSVYESVAARERVLCEALEKVVRASGDKTTTARMLAEQGRVMRVRNADGYETFSVDGTPAITIGPPKLSCYVKDHQIVFTETYPVGYYTAASTERDSRGTLPN
jgi:hypothetical protein